MNKRVIKIFLLIAAIVVLLKGGAMIYRTYFSCNEKLIVSDQRDAVNTFTQSKTKDCAYNRMILLVEAGQRVIELEHLYMAKASDAELIDEQTIRALIKEMSRERLKFKRRLTVLKDRMCETGRTNKLRSLSYYLRVLEDGIQDLEILLTNRARSQSRAG